MTRRSLNIHGALKRFIVPGMKSFSGTGLNSNQKAVGCPHNNHATLAHVGIYCLGGPQLGMTIGDFSSPVVCIAFLILWMLANKEFSSLVPVRCVYCSQTMRYLYQ